MPIFYEIDPSIDLVRTTATGTHGLTAALVGRYIIERELVAGGIACVYRNNG